MGEGCAVRLFYFSGQTYALTFYEHAESVFLGAARHDFWAYAGQKRLHFLIVRALCGDFSTQTAFTRHPGAGGLSRTSLSGNCCLWADNKKMLIFPAKPHAQKSCRAVCAVFQDNTLLSISQNKSMTCTVKKTVFANLYDSGGHSCPKMAYKFAKLYFCSVCE